MTQAPLKFALAALTTAALLAACGGGDDDSNDNNNETGWQTDGQVKLQFAAYNGATPIDCSSSLKLGTQGRAVKMADFRFYISNVHLLKPDGSKVALALSHSDDYNHTEGADSVSLIDLEQRGVGACTGGSDAVNATIEGSVPAGTYTGVEMTLGVPLALNHLHATDPATPRVLQTPVHPAMAWNWRGGMKFTNIQFNQDTATDDTPWASANEGKDGYVLLHLGSTGCIGDPANGVPVTSCKAPNRVPVTLAEFDPSQQLIAFDAGALFNYDIASDTEGRTGCMAGPTDPGCAKPFEALALDWQADGSGTGVPVASHDQQVLKAVTR